MNRYATPQTCAITFLQIHEVFVIEGHACWTCCKVSRGSRAAEGYPASLFRYSRYFCKWLATFSRVIPSTFISCRIVFGTACFTPCEQHTKALTACQWATEI